MPKKILLNELVEDYTYFLKSVELDENLLIWGIFENFENFLESFEKILEKFVIFLEKSWKNFRNLRNF